MKVVSLFSGIGGFDLAFKRQGHQIVYANEWDKYASKIYQERFGEIDTTDIRKVASADVPEHEIICAGFPCQAFSVAGKRLGFDDTRGTLFREIMRIAKHHRTKYLLLENVKGLLSDDNGRTFAVILATMDELGYDAQWQVLNSKNFGVPQNRERIFIVGHIRGEARPEVFPITKAKEIPRESGPGKQGKEQKVSSTIDSRYGALRNAGETYIVSGTLRTHKDGRGFRELHENIAPTIPARARNDGSGQPVIFERKTGSFVRRQPLRFLNRNQKNIEGDYSFTIDSSQTSGVCVDDDIRRFTPLECERLQGFPDDWTAGISDSQRYKCLGNAVTVNVVEEIVKRFSV